MRVTEFVDILQVINSIEDIVISDITYDDKGREEITKFKKELHNMKAWYTPTSSDHKKRFVVDLLLKIRSVYTVSIVLKCIWNCYLKDAVMSGCDIKPWIGYDQTPLDHDRAMQLSPELARLEDEHRVWFFSLSPEMQAFALCDLLRISGGPIVWAATKVARRIHYDHRQREIEYIKRSFESVEMASNTTKNTQSKVEAPSYPSDKRMSVNEKKDDENVDSKLDQALKRRDAQLKAWNTLVSAMRSELKVEEINITFMDGVDRTIWKLNKVDNETTETVDTIQLLPSAVGKRILSYIPDRELDTFARVNKYWSYLVEDYRAESAMRTTIQCEVKRLEESIFPERDQRLLLEDKSSSSHYFEEQSSSESNSSRKFDKVPSIKTLSKKIPIRKAFTPIKSLKQLSERIQVRGAADDVIFRRLNTASHRLCANIKEQIKEDNDVVYSTKYFTSSAVNAREVFNKGEGSSYDLSNKERCISPQMYKQLNLWTTNLSSLYPVLKIASYELPL